jgi:hypothetical protein
LRNSLILLHYPISCIALPSSRMLPHCIIGPCGSYTRIYGIRSSTNQTAIEFGFLTSLVPIHVAPEVCIP